MAFATIIVETFGSVTRITLNRPERTNALNQAMLGEIGEALDGIERDKNIRALIVRGAGTAFSSGFDLKEQMERRPQGIEQWRPILRKDFDTIMRFWHCPLPTIAAVRGPCLAGACELALACDITIAADDAFFGEPELKFGAGIVAMILPWIVGPKAAKEIILTGEDRIPAARAKEIGMVNRIVPVAELDETALRWHSISPRSIQIWSRKPSARSTVRSKRRTCCRRWKRRSPSISRSKARARPTRGNSWTSRAVMD